MPLLGSGENNSTNNSYVSRGEMEEVIRKALLLQQQPHHSPEVQMGAADVPALQDFTLKAVNAYRRHFNACGRLPDQTLMDTEVHECIDPIYAREMRGKVFKVKGWQEHGLLSTENFCNMLQKNLELNQTGEEFENHITELQSWSKSSLVFDIRNMQEAWKMLGYIKTLYSRCERKLTLEEEKQLRTRFVKHVNLTSAAGRVMTRDNIHDWCFEMVDVTFRSQDVSDQTFPPWIEIFVNGMADSNSLYIKSVKYGMGGGNNNNNQPGK
jgi:2'-5' RNA ligase